MKCKRELLTSATMPNLLYADGACLGNEQRDASQRIMRAVVSDGRGTILVSVTQPGAHRWLGIRCPASTPRTNLMKWKWSFLIQRNRDSLNGSTRNAS